MQSPETPSRLGLGISISITAAMIAGSWWAMTHEGVQKKQSAPEPETTPVLNVDGSITKEFEGHSWRCLPMNNPEFMNSFDPGKPTVTVGLDAMRIMGDTTPPFLIIRGSDGPIKVHQTFAQEFKSMANGALTCIDGK